MLLTQQKVAEAPMKKFELFIQRKKNLVVINCSLVYRKSLLGFYNIRPKIYFTALTCTPKHESNSEDICGPIKELESIITKPILS